MGKRLENKVGKKSFFSILEELRDRRVEEGRLMKVNDWDQIYKIDLILAGVAISGFVAMATCIYLHNHLEVYETIKESIKNYLGF